jgi:DNA-binding response OmpR family regulator
MDIARPDTVTVTVRVEVTGPEPAVCDRVAALLHVVGRDAEVVPVAPPRPVAVPPLVLYPDRARVTLDGVDVRLTYREFRLLTHLASNPGRVFTRDELLRTVWAQAHPSGHRTVDVHVRRLRAKLAGRGPAIVTVRGVGYRLDRGEHVSVVRDGAPPAVRSA